MQAYIYFAVFVLTWFSLVLFSLWLISLRDDKDRVREHLEEFLFKAAHGNEQMAFLIGFAVLPLTIPNHVYHIIKWKK